MRPIAAAYVALDIGRLRGQERSLRASLLDRILADFENLDRQEAAGARLQAVHILCLVTLW